MIDDLDEALRRLLIRELPIKKNEIDIAFEQPKRDWSARLSRPTVNLFLFDMRENAKLRASHVPWESTRDAQGKAVQKRRPMRMDLRYLVTAWANEPEDEHRLLSRTLLALIRFPEMPHELLPDILHEQPVPIPLQVAQADLVPNTSDLWSALENTFRTGLVLQVTLAMDPYVTLPVAPLVRTRELRFGQTDHPGELPVLAEPAEADVFWSIGGTLTSKRGALSNAQIKLVERDYNVPISAEGRFAISRLIRGEYTLHISYNNRIVRELKITVPAPDYDLEI